MLGSIKSIYKIKRDQRGVTLVELMLVIGVTSLVIASFLTISVYLFGDTIRSSLYSRLANEAQTILRSVVDELRVSSSIRASALNNDPNAPPTGWTTSNDDLILVISTPALDNNNNFIIDANTGYPYQNEIVYFAEDNVLYKRYLANENATNNSMRTSCPAELTSPSCPGDVVMSENFDNLSFIFYDQDDNVTSVLANARSTEVTIDMVRRSFGRDLTFNNTIRITLRNNTY